MWGWIRTDSALPKAIRFIGQGGGQGKQNGMENGMEKGRGGEQFQKEKGVRLASIR